MTWAFLLIVLVVAGIMSLSGARRVEWANKLRRRSHEPDIEPEWIAPDQIIQRICDDYLVASEWLNGSALEPWSKQWALASVFLAGIQLQRHQKILTRLRTGRISRFVGIMACTHELDVRYFSEDGERCLVIDRQYHRRITTYDVQKYVALQTQDMQSGMVVYQMVYDSAAQRWKIEAYIQELPLNVPPAGTNDKVRFTNTLPVAWRDN